MSTFTCVFVCVLIYMCVHVLTLCACVCMYVYMSVCCVCVFVYMCVPACLHVCKHMHVFVNSENIILNTSITYAMTFKKTVFSQ